MPLDMSDHSVHSGIFVMQNATTMSRRIAIHTIRMIGLNMIREIVLIRMSATNLVSTVASKLSRMIGSQIIRMFAAKWSECARSETN